jgi:hypothetical protein
MHTAGLVTTLRGLRGRAVQLHELRKIHVRAERAFNNFQVRLVAVRGELPPIRQPARHVLHEVVGILGIAAAGKSSHFQTETLPRPMFRASPVFSDGSAACR